MENKMKKIAALESFVWKGNELTGKKEFPDVSKRLFRVVGLLLVLISVGSCVTPNSQAEAEAEYVPPVVSVAAPSADPGIVVLDEAVVGTSVNSLVETLGPVGITIRQDTSYVSNDPIPGGRIRLVEFLGKKALEVTQNFNNEIRVAFVLDQPRTLEGFSTLSFNIAGLDGSGGAYNCGLLYTDTNQSGERLGSFYVSPVSTSEWTSVEMNLVEDEVWGNRFSGERVLYSIQFWTNQTKAIYITDLALR